MRRALISTARCVKNDIDHNRIMHSVVTNLCNPILERQDMLEDRMKRHSDAIIELMHDVERMETVINYMSDRLGLGVFTNSESKK